MPRERTVTHPDRVYPLGKPFHWWRDTDQDPRERLSQPRQASHCYRWATRHSLIRKLRALKSDPDRHWLGAQEATTRGGQTQVIWVDGLESRLQSTSKTENYLSTHFWKCARFGQFAIWEAKGIRSRKVRSWGIKEPEQASSAAFFWVKASVLTKLTNI